MGRFLAASVFDEGQTGEVRLIFLGRAQKESRLERRLSTQREAIKAQPYCVKPSW
jgi:hypothetical protein